MHARAAAKLVKTANQFVCDLNIYKGDQSANAKSIMGLLTLAAGRGRDILLEATGEDAEAAIDAVCDLINQKFGES